MRRDSCLGALRHSSAAVVLATVFHVSAGCSFSIGVGGGPSAPPADDALVAEVDAVHLLSFDREQLDHLRRIAARPGLSSVELCHVLDVGLAVLSFDDNRTQLMLTVIENPGLDEAGRAHVTRRVRDLGFSRNRRQVLRAIQERAEADARVDPAAGDKAAAENELPEAA